MGSAMDGYKPWLKKVETTEAKRPKMTLAVNWFRLESNNAVFIKDDVSDDVWKLAVRVCCEKPETYHICLVCDVPSKNKSTVTTDPH